MAFCAKMGIDDPSAGRRDASRPKVSESLYQFQQARCTRNFLTFVNTTAIAYHQNHDALTDFLPICNSSRVYKRQKITSTVLV